MSKEEINVLSNNTTENAIDESGIFSYTLRKPKEYNGVRYEVLDFDFETLTGADAIAIETELQTLGKAAFMPAFSSEYLVRMAAKACKQPIGADFFNLLSITDFESVKKKARSFLLMSE